MEFDLHGLTLVEAIREYPEQACIIMQKQAMELAQRADNSAMVPCCYFNLPKLACNLFPNRKCGAKACLLKAQHQ